MNKGRRASTKSVILCEGFLESVNFRQTNFKQFKTTMDVYNEYVRDSDLPGNGTSVHILAWVASAQRYFR
eukprot:2730810-Amphidinium_carterae.1